MLRRLLTMFATAFLVLGCLFGVASAGAGTGESAATASNTPAIAARASIRGTLNQDVPDGGVTQRADEDDAPDRAIRIGTAFRWPEPASTLLSHADAGIGPTHRPCASPPRAPPAA
jgi:hypothetical protein